ncbi:MAG: hypothetical protein KJ737_02320 [Proteobacteria bacterium]|nr:hypothetical protein [Pseudomonadota bacterium]
MNQEEATIEKIPICTECIHCSEYNEALACFRKKPAIDPVDGSEIFPRPKICRIERAEMTWAWWACGKKGKFFIQKEELPQEKNFIEQKSA